MKLRFPSMESFLAALRTDVVPRDVAEQPVAARRQPDGSLECWTLTTFSPEQRRALESFGVALDPIDPPVGATTQHACWLELLPIARTPRPTTLGDKSVVLFSMLDHVFPSFSAEMLRLGNDRQGLRQLEGSGAGTTLLRVIGPPYYSLLRAIDAADDPEAPRAFVERAPRVWVRWGFDMPLVERLQVPPGRWLLLDSPHCWTWLDESPFRDLYEVVEFSVPQGAPSLVARPLEQKLRVALRLDVATTSGESAELWVLKRDALGQVERFVQSADENLLDRLAFAVGESGGIPTVILRLRPSRQPPPVLVLDAIELRPHLRLPNLFVPLGYRLQPILRRDIIASLLAAESSQIVWLEPAERGQFAPRSVPDNAFRPLSDWIEYVLDQNHAALATWMASHQFAFESFVTETPTAPRETSGGAKPKPPRERDTLEPTPAAAAMTGQEVEEEVVVAELVPEELVEPDTQLPTLDEQRSRLRELESRYLALEEPLDSADRQRLWWRMVAANRDVDNERDAFLCWLHAMWETPHPTSDELGAFAGWRTGYEDRATWSRSLASILNDPAPNEQQARQVAAWLAQIAGDHDVLAGMESFLPSTARFLEACEDLLPVRALWLAWASYSQLAHGDVLALARARDRLLARLFQHGLRIETDVVSFIRSAGLGDGNRFQRLQDELLKLRELIQAWVVEPVSGGGARTACYADLIIAYGLARVGADTEARKIVEWAKSKLVPADPVHRWLSRAYEYRIQHALNHQRNQASLEDGLLEQLEGMDRLDRYKIDRLRQHSRILEPFERIDPYRRWHRRHSDDLSRVLAGWSDVRDPQELDVSVRHLLSTSLPPDARLRATTAALALSPRLGDAFAQEILAQVLPQFRAATEPTARAMLLEKGLAAASHFGHEETVQVLATQFESSIEEIVPAYLEYETGFNPESAERLAIIESLFTYSFRGLRRLGLRQEINRIFQRVVEVVAGAESSRVSSSRRSAPEPVRPADRAAKLQLSVAGGWFFFGQETEARRITDRVAAQLAAPTLSHQERRTLACAYLAAVGLAPMQTALTLVTSLFSVAEGESRGSSLPRICDNMTTNSHFSLSQLHVIESAVLALVNDEMAVTTENRHWLDEDEYLIRRRVHADMRAAMPPTNMSLSRMPR